MNEEKPPHLARSMWKRFVLAGMLIVVLAGATTATGVLLQVNDLTKAIRQGGKPISGLQAILERAAAGSPQTILVIGSDRRFKDRRDAKNARSDTIILLRLNPRASATTIMSIPRDLEVHYHRGAPPDKINAAYSKGGPAATARIVKRVLSSPGDPFRINHIININFGGFRAVVDRLGCVYADVDRRYFNDNNPPVASPTDYATINIQPGYQRLCGQKALDYVRFRHLDTDIVRNARQQDFLRQAKQQYGSSRFISNRRALARIFGRYTQSDKDLHSETGLLKLLDLVIFSASRPIQEVHFPARLGDATDPFVHASPSDIRRAVRVFLEGAGAPKPKVQPKPRTVRRKRGRKRAKPVAPSAVPGLVDATSAGEQQGLLAGAKVNFPVFYPRLITSRGNYVGPDSVYPRAYRLSVGGRRYGAYRLVLFTGVLGDYYGLQGTSWKNPPLLRDPSETRRVNGRKLELFYDGHRLRFVAWRTNRAVYWVSNTLLESISNRQMIGMAASLSRIGSHR